MIKIIAHLADIHVRKSPTRHEEYRAVFSRLYKSLEKKKPDRIVIVGDLFHDYIDIQPEAMILVGEFLNRLAEISKVIITRGNHDIRKTSSKRIDSIQAIVETIKNPNIVYYNETGFFDDENVTWAVWKHGEKKNNPWGKRKKPTEGNTVIDLFHNPINGAVSETGYEIKSSTRNNIEHFKGDYSFFGDIHKLQFFSDDTKAYSGSLVAQNFGEGDDDFHGYILWNIESGDHEEISIKNDYSFNTVELTAFTDFDDLELDIDNPTKKMRVRVRWNTLPDTFNEENKRKVVKHLNEQYGIILMRHDKHFIEDEDVIVEEDIDVTTITDQEVQHEIFTAYLNKIGVEDDMIDEIISLDDEIASRVENEELTNLQWDVVKFSGKNFMSYEDIEVDWRDLNGLFQITGLNTAGKTTIMKLITYILYNKTRETEKTMKFGDTRYVNNRIDVDNCEGTVVISVNGEYYGIKRKTKIEKTKKGEIKGAPTKVEFYKLTTPDDEFLEDNEIDNLVEDERRLTQKSIDRAIGSYDNFMRVVMTTSDTLNEVLSSDKSIFIDSLLFDSGLDLFDHKLKAFKEYVKEFSSVPRVSCNVESSEEKIESLQKTNIELDEKISVIETETIPEVEASIEKGNNYIQTLASKMHQVDAEISSLNVESVKENIGILDENIKILSDKSKRLEVSMSTLKENYDVEKLQKLTELKDSHKSKEYELKMVIRDHETQITNVQHEIGVIKGEVVRLKESGKQAKDNIFKLRNEKNCPTCGQLLDEKHQEHINVEVKEIEKTMFDIAKKIGEKEKQIPSKDEMIADLNKKIGETNTKITDMSVEMEKILSEIGVITNDKNEVEKRKELMVEYDKIPIQIENYQLQKQNLSQKIELYEKSKSQIQENEKIDQQIAKAKERLGVLNRQKESHKDDVYTLNTTKGQNITQIADLTKLIQDYKVQERRDRIHDIYKRCIHRDGLPTQLLKTYAIPKINSVLGDLLEDVAFDVWLDEDDLKLKLAYDSKIDAVIDALSASGKERTFASVALKFALNQINLKSKPSLFLLDEVMGKLTDESVDEFIDILKAITSKMSKVLIVEHNHEIEPDHVLSVTKNEDGISSLEVA